jgi:hypothetical protein
MGRRLMLQQFLLVRLIVIICLFHDRVLASRSNGKHRAGKLPEYATQSV